MDWEKSDNKKFERGREYKIDQEKPSWMYEYSLNTINCKIKKKRKFKKKKKKKKKKHGKGRQFQDHPPLSP